MNLLFIYETDMPTVSLTRNHWLCMSDKYNIRIRFRQLLEVSVDDLNWCNILLMIRPDNSLSYRIAISARKAGRLIITCCDDDLLNLPKSYPVLTWQTKGLIKALNQSDILITHSRYIMDKMIKFTFGKRKVYSDTIVRSEDLLVRNYEKENYDTVKIVYAAGSMHEKMFEKFVLPALTHVAKKTSKKLSITFVSVHPKCKKIGNLVDVNYVQGMPLEDYRKYMEIQKFDIGVSPLEETEFSKCKYFNKYLEYTLSGVIGIYSNVEPYTYVVEDGVNGFLADNTVDGWEKKLMYAIENCELRILCAKKAQKHVRECFNENYLMSKMVENIPEIQTVIKNQRDCHGFSKWRMIYRLLRVLEFSYKALFYMKSEGVCSVKRKTISRMKRLLFMSVL